MIFFSGIISNINFFNAHTVVAYRFLVRNPEGTKPLGRPRRRWEDYIKMSLQKVAWGFGLLAGPCKRDN
jgi:hypothetical protein